jgi:hypothetical protein
VRATKPKIPESVMKNFVELELKTNELELSKIENEINMLKSENSHKLNILDAESFSKLSQVDLEMDKMQQEFQKKKLDIECKFLTELNLI